MPFAIRLQQLASQPWALALLLPLLAIFIRPAIPLDETRYLAVAWEMWWTDEFLLPALNGVPYPDKPPLLFWLMHAGWSVLGVNDWWPRLLPALFFSASLALLPRTAVAFGLPARAGTAAGFLLLACLVPLLFSQQLMFDYVLLPFLLLALERSATAVRTGSYRDLLLAGVAIGLGGLSKGPIMLVYYLPVAIVALPLLAPQARRWPDARLLGRLGLVLLAGIAVAGLWLAALAWQGRLGFLQVAVLDQAADRLAGEIGHGRPLWWYLPVLPLFILPGMLSFSLLRAFGRAWQAAMPRRLLYAALLILLALSLIGGKQPHYLLPWLPLVLLAGAAELDFPGTVRHWAAAVSAILLASLLLLAAMLGIEPLATVSIAWLGMLQVAGLIGLACSASGTEQVLRQRALIVIATGALLLLALRPPLLDRFDLRDTATRAAGFAASERPLAWTDVYHGELNFYGRLQVPVREVVASELPEWMQRHPRARLFARKEFMALLGACTELQQRPYRSSSLHTVADCSPD